MASTCKINFYKHFQLQLCVKLRPVTFFNPSHGHHILFPLFFLFISLNLLSLLLQFIIVINIIVVIVEGLVIVVVVAQLLWLLLLLFYGYFL